MPEMMYSISHWGLFNIPGKANWLEVPLKDNGTGYRVAQNFYESIMPACYQRLSFGPELP